MNETCINENHIRSCECHLRFDQELCLPVCCLKCESLYCTVMVSVFCVAVKLSHTGENRGWEHLRTVLKKILGLKWEERREGWGELHHGLHDLCICSQILGCFYF
jgi:hypothetical protein